MSEVGVLNQAAVEPIQKTGRAADIKKAENPDFSRLLTVKGLPSSFPAETFKSPPNCGGELPLRGMEEDASRQTIRERFSSGRVAPSPRRAHNSTLSKQEQIEKLAKIRNSAVEYESVYVDQLVKQMRQSPLAKTPGGDTFSDIAEQPFRNFLSQAGGLGLADVIVTRIANEEGLGDTLRANPEIMRPGYQQKIAPSEMTRGAGRMSAPAGGNLSPGEASPIGLNQSAGMKALSVKNKEGLAINRQPKLMTLPGRRAAAVKTESE